MSPAMEGMDDPHHFEFDLDRGIRTQVVEKLETSPLLPLLRGVGPIKEWNICPVFQGSPGLHRQSVERNYKEPAHVTPTAQ